jgi:hypothetical protein
VKQIHRILIILVGLSALVCRAGLVNGSVDVSTIYDANSINVSSDLDQGWHARDTSLYNLSMNDVWFGGFMYQPGYWFGQIYTDNYATHGVTKFSFDVTYMGANIQSPCMQYTIFGANSTDLSQTALALNVDEAPAGPAWTAICSGSISTPSTNSYVAELDFGDSGYKYIGVRLRFSGTPVGRGIDYATAVDDISVVAKHDVVPEPAAMALAGLGGIITLIATRLGRNKATC